jgi:phage tail sheath protein FI
MPEYLAPGVYVEEISTGPTPIEGVSTSVAGFLGPTERGPEYVKLITSWLEFQRWYGGHVSSDQTFMTYAVQGFFDNGGKRCYVARVTSQNHTGANTGLNAGIAASPDTASGNPLGNLQLVAIGAGNWGNNVFVKIQKATNTSAKAADWFRLRLLYYTTKPAKAYDPNVVANRQKADYVPPDYVEDFDNLSIVPSDVNSVITTVNGGSQLIRVRWNANGPAKLTIDSTADFAALLAGGKDGQAMTALGLDDYLGTSDAVGGFDKDPQGRPSDLLGRASGFQGVAMVKEISLLLAPDQAREAAPFPLLGKIVTDCEDTRDRFGILSVPLVFPIDNPTPSADTTYAAQYYPWIKVYDPVTQDEILIPPVGHVAGIIARTDIDVGVHKAPANQVVIGATNLQKPVPKGDQDVLNPVGINCIRDFRTDGRGIRLWGARTMTSDPEWKYVNVRRLFLFVEQSIDRGTQWVVFEPNSDPTWARVVRTITAFLVTVWRSGALMGTTQEQAFFVKCDRTTMTQDDLDNGRLICYVGLAPVKPAEFVIFRIGQMTADAQSS